MTGADVAARSSSSPARRTPPAGARREPALPLGRARARIGHQPRHPRRRATSTSTSSPPPTRRASACRARPGLGVRGAVAAPAASRLRLVARHRGHRRCSHSRSTPLRGRPRPPRRAARPAARRRRRRHRRRDPARGGRRRGRVARRRLLLHRAVSQLPDEPSASDIVGAGRVRRGGRRRQRARRPAGPPGLADQRGPRPKPRPWPGWRATPCSRGPSRCRTSSSELRRTFELDGVAVLDADGDELAHRRGRAGSPVPARPEEATVAAELADGTVLVLAGATLGAEDTPAAQRVRGASSASRRSEPLLEAAGGAATELGRGQQPADRAARRGVARPAHAARRPSRRRPRACSPTRSTGRPSDRTDFAKTIDAEADRLDPPRGEPARHEPPAGRGTQGRVSAVASKTCSTPRSASLGGGPSRASSTCPTSSAGPQPTPACSNGPSPTSSTTRSSWSPAGDVVRVEAGARSATRRRARDRPRARASRPTNGQSVFEPFQRLGDRPADAARRGRPRPRGRPRIHEGGWTAKLRSRTLPAAAPPSCSTCRRFTNDHTREPPRTDSVGRRRRDRDPSCARHEPAGPRLQGADRDIRAARPSADRDATPSRRRRARPRPPGHGRYRCHPRVAGVVGGADHRALRPRPPRPRRSLRSTRAPTTT